MSQRARKAIKREKKTSSSQNESADVQADALTSKDKLLEATVQTCSNHGSDSELESRECAPEQLSYSNTVKVAASVEGVQEIKHQYLEMDQWPPPKKTCL